MLAWHEGRLRPVPIVRDPSTQARVVANWSIPLVVDGRRTTLVGSEWYASGPSPWPWLVAGALLVALGGVGARLLSRRMQRLVASVLLPVAVVALAAAWFGTLLSGGLTLPTLLFAIAFAAVTAFFLLVVVVAANGAEQLGVMGLLGGFTATFALPQIGVFAHGFVLSALPAFAARLSGAIAVVGGVVVATVCIPAAITLLELPKSARH